MKKEEGASRRSRIRSTLQLLGLFAVLSAVFLLKPLEAKAADPLYLTSGSSGDISVLNSDAISKIIVTENCTVSSITTVVDLVINQGITLNVSGSITQKAGSLQMGTNSRLTVSGITFQDTGHIWETSDTAKVTVNGPFVYTSTGESGYNYCGWSVSGNVTHNPSSNGGYLSISSLVLTGNSPQTISISQNNNGYISKLTVSDPSNAVSVPGYLNSVTMGSDVIINAGANTQFNGITLSGHNMTINGDVLAISDFKVSDTSTLTVNGKYTQTKGSIQAGTNAVVNITGDMVLSGTGTIWSTSDKSKFTIGGNLDYTSTSDVGYNSAAWNIPGNIIQDEDENTGDLWLSELVLTGNAPQTLQLNSNAAVSKLTVKDPTIEVNVPSYLKNMTLGSNAIIKPGSNTKFSNVTLGGYNMTVNGDVLAISDFKVSEKSTLTVNGKYTQTGGSIQAGTNAVVNITGDMVMSDTGTIWSTSDKSKFTIGGNLDYTSTSDVGYNSAKWNIPGNIIQDEDEDTGDLWISELVLTGNAPQTLQLKANAAVSKLTVKDPTIEVNVPGYLKDMTLGSDAIIKPGSNTKFSNVTLGGHNMTVNGDVLAISDFKVSEKSTLTVNGKYTQTKGSIQTGTNAVVNITGDMVMSDTGTIWSTSDKSKFTIGGNLDYTSTSDVGYNSATWNIPGNIIQDEDEDTGDLWLSELVLTGKAPQTLQFKANGAVSKLTVKDPTIEVNVPGYLKGMTLGSDAIIKPGSNTQFGNVTLGGYNMTVNGDVLAFSDFKVSEKSTLTVNGKYTQTGGSIQTGTNAVVTVTGDMVMSDTGTVWGTNDKSSFHVGGSVQYTSSSDTGYNSAAWTVVAKVHQHDGAGWLYFNRLELPTKDTGAAFTNGKAGTLVLGYGESHYELIPDNCYDKLIATSTVTFDANGGKVSPAQRLVTTDQAYGELPVPEKSGESFDGWFDDPEEGERIYDTTIVEETDDHVLYAHWGSPLGEGEERISPEDKDRIKSAKEQSVPVSKDVKISGSETLSVSASTNYKDVTTFTGKKTDIKNALEANVDVSDIISKITFKTGKETDNPDDLFKFNYVTTSINAGDAEFYCKLEVKSGAKSYMSSKEVKRLKKIVSGINKALKAQKCKYWINPISITNCSPKVVAKFKGGKIQVGDEGVLKSIKKVTVKIGTKTITLKKSMYETSGADAENGTVILKGKGNYTGKKVVEVKKK